MKIFPNIASSGLGKLQGKICKTTEGWVMELCLGWQVTVWGSRLKQTNRKLRRKRGRRMRSWTALPQRWRRAVVAPLSQIHTRSCSSKPDCLYETHHGCLYMHTTTSRHDPPYWRGLEVASSQEHRSPHRASACARAQGSSSIQELEIAHKDASSQPVCVKHGLIHNRWKHTKNYHYFIYYLSFFSFFF